MIRASDIAGAVPWTSPLLTPSSRADERFATTSAGTWFDAGELTPQASIFGDLGPAARGLSVEQHAGRVLMHLRDETDRGA
jgi:hypothetical protein